MTFGQLVRKNVIRQKRLYLGYVASCSVSVMTLFLFMNVAYNPAVVHGFMPSAARVIMLASGWIVGLFSVFFIFYFHAAMLRLRGQEFGVLQVLGTTPKQLGRMVMLESVLADGVALGCGLLLGLLFTKLFLLILGDLMALPSEIPFAAPARSWLLTCVVFILIFAFEAYLMTSRIRRRGPKELIVGKRSRQKPPRPSILLSLLGILLLALGYYLAIARSIQTLASLIGLLVIIALVIAGTYLVYTQGLVWLLMYLRRRVQSGVSVLIVSRLAHRMKDHARALTVISTLSAVVMTASASQLGLLSVLKQGEAIREPFAVMTWTNSAHPLALAPRQITQKLQAAGAGVTMQLTGTALEGSLQQPSAAKGTRSVTVVSASTFEDFVDAIRSHGADRGASYPNVPHLKPGHALYVASFPLMTPTQFHSTPTTLRVGTADEEPLVVDGQINERTFNFGTTAVSDYVLIVSDPDFHQLAAKAPKDSVWAVHGWMASDRARASSAFGTQLPSSQVSVVEPTDVSTLRLFSTMIFAGMFISLMMLLACGNTIYFRLLNNQAEDRVQFRALRRTGITHRELGRVLTVEFSVLFFLPFLLAVLHTIAAVIDYRHVLMVPGRLWPMCLAVMLVYFGFMIIYFVIARFTYPRQLRIDQPNRTR